MDVAALENRIRLLTEMEKEYEGFSNAVKLVMQAAEKKALRGVHGPVASLMKTQEKYTVALEIALGAGMQNIVVDREEDGKAAIGYLKQRNGGRATFLPMTAVRGDVLREDVSGEYGFVGLAVDLVTYDKSTTAFSAICWAVPWWWRIWTAALPWPGNTATASGSSRWTAR